MNPQVGIVSTGDDIHALAVAQILNDEFDVKTWLIGADQVAGSGSLTWSSGKNASMSCPTTAGAIDPAELDVLWWRRISFPQLASGGVSNSGHAELVNNDCRSALQGLLLNRFRGTWVSEPYATAAAENKLVQLQTASGVGLNIPRTVVTQDISVVQQFREAVGPNNIIIKAVRGTRQAPAVTTMLTDAHMNPDSIALAPAIYQEYIPGALHIRACLFGSEVLAFGLHSEDLDWRLNLDIPVTEVAVRPDILSKLQEMLEALRLRMGIFDLKLDGNGVPVFLEVNPQGQFLFLEGLSGVDATRPCARFLQREASEASGEKRALG